MESLRMSCPSLWKNRTYMYRFVTPRFMRGCVNPRMEICVNSESTYPHGTAFITKQCLYQKEATGMESLKMSCPNR